MSGSNIEHSTPVRLPVDVDPESVAVRHICGHCNGGPARVTGKVAGVWQVFVPHTDGCPVLGGGVSAVPDIVRAALAARAPLRMQQPAPRAGRRRARRRRHR